MLDPILENNLSAIVALCKKHKVEKLFAFGSVVKGNFRADSDVDLLVSYLTKEIREEDYADNYFDFTDELEKLLGKKVDLISAAYIKNPYFIESVNMSKISLYAA